MNEEWLSAHLDGELSAEETAELEAALADDAALRAVLDDLDRVRTELRAAGVEPRAGAFDRIMSAVAAPDADEPLRPAAPVVSLDARRRVPTVAAIAAALVIIASVVGGIGGPGSLPAIGDLVDQHVAAAAVLDGEPMPPDMDHMDDMPMLAAMEVAPPMPSDFSMQHAFASGSMVQLVYSTPQGEAVSVFRHEGDTDLDALGDGSVSRLAEGDMWSGDRDEAHIAVIDGTGYVWVVISATPHDEMMSDLMHDLPTRSASIGERLRETADAAIEPFRFWD